MDNRLQNLLGYDSSNGYTLSMSKTGKHMMSRNGGDKWSSISPKHFSTVSFEADQIGWPKRCFHTYFVCFQTSIGTLW